MMTKEEMAMWARLHDAWEHYEPKEMDFEAWLSAMETVTMAKHTKPPLLLNEQEPTMQYLDLREQYFDLLETTTAIIRHVRARWAAPTPPKSTQTEMFVDWFAEDTP